MTVYITGPKDRAKLPDGITVYNTTSRAPSAWGRALSPFSLGPCKLYWGLTAQNVENAWQYSKVYEHHVGCYGRGKDDVGEKWFPWALKGFAKDGADRYPYGKEFTKGDRGKPLFSYWAGRRLNYLEARKLIYIPLYALAVLRTEAYRDLCWYNKRGIDLALWDFDGYQGPRTLSEALNNLKRPLGHAFVLRAMLEEPVEVEKLITEHYRSLR